MIERELNRRHIRALLRLSRRNPSLLAISRYQLEAAIGAYSGNTILSLQSRELIATDDAGAHYRLTENGRELVNELQRDFLS